MFKLIKYELRSTFFTILGICISVIIASLLLMTKKDSWGNAVTAFSVCLAIGAIIVIFISSLKIMSKYLYGDEGYLLFTLPQSGVSIITSRLITALIQVSIILFVSFIMCYITITGGLDLSYLKNLNLKASEVIYYIISYIWSIISFLTLIYFCMVIGKVALKGKKLGKIGSFIIFIILSISLSWLSFKLITFFPKTLNLNDFSITSNYDVLNSDFSVSSGAYTMNFAQTIFDIIAYVGFFITTSFLIDKKLDLS